MKKGMNVRVEFYIIILLPIKFQFCHNKPYIKYWSDSYIIICVTLKSSYSMKKIFYALMLNKLGV